YCRRYLKDKDAAVRYLACRSLARLGSEPALTILMDLSTDDTATLSDRASAVEALVAEAHSEGYKLAEKKAFDDKTAPSLRAAAIRLLADSPEDSLDRRLLTLTSSAPQPVLIAAIDTIAKRGTREGLRAAASVVQNPNKDLGLALAAIIGLGRSMAPDARKPLEAVATDPEWPSHVRRYAIEGLARLANRAGQETIADITPVSSEAHNWLAARLLDLKSGASTMDLLLPHLTGPYRTSACAAAERLGETGYGPAVRELLEGGSVFDNHTRMSHIWAAIRSKGDEAVEALTEAAVQPRQSIRSTSARALGGRRGRQRADAVEALHLLARDKHARTRQGALEALQLVGDPKSFDLFADLALNDPDLRVAREAARALRLREFRSAPGREKVLQAIAGTERDPGGLTGNSPSVSSQQDNSFVLRTWAEHIEEDLVANLTYESSLCYDRHNKRTVMWGAHGRRYDSPQTGQTWFFDGGDSFMPWRRLTDSRHWPNGLCLVRGTAYDAANRAVINPHAGGGGSHGWHNDLRRALAYSSPWILDVQTDQWYAARPPVNRTFSPTPASHDPVHGVTWWWRGRMIGFDVYANDWVKLETRGPGPSYKSNSGAVFDPRTGRFIVIGRHSTWALNTSKGIWKDLEPEGPHPPACPMVYDSANEVMLAFQERDDHVEVWVYHIDENRWQLLPPVNPSPLAATIWDATYDEANNVAIISGTWSRTSTGGQARRETWTYRYKEAPPRVIGSRVPADVRCVTSQDGSVTVRWKAPQEGETDRYRIEWGYAEEPWKVDWKSAGTTDGKTYSYTHKPQQRRLAFYRVIALDKEGHLSRPSFPARTVPRIVSHISAVADSDGKVHLNWTPSAQDDVTGYHIYRLRIKPGNAWRRRLRPRWKDSDLQRLTEKPATKAEFVDTSAAIQGKINALHWPDSSAYSVRAVNQWGLESGDSPMTPALPQPPGPVRIVPWADGERLVFWSGSEEPNVRGSVLWRMDTWQSSAPRRLHSGSLLCPAWRDSDIFLRGDRRRYYASGIDAMGTVGIPTSGAWSHGLP
ncbi:MAG: HEAT repeat domain-containing protein, partial [Verrucomicrobiota bacterium]